MDRFMIKLVLNRYVNAMSKSLNAKLKEYEPHEDKKEEWAEFCRTFVKEFKSELDRTLVKPALKKR